MRRSAALTSLLATGLLVGLAACTPSGGEPETPENPEVSAECVPSGEASDAIQVEGEFGSLPEVTFDGPLEPTSTEREVLSDGEGEIVEEGDVVDIDFAIYNGRTGELIEATPFGNGQPVQWRVDLTNPALLGFSEMINCSSIGSRLVGVIPPAQGFGGEAVPSLGLEADDSLVLVLDVIGEYVEPVQPEPLAGVEGEERPLPEGFPALTVDGDGVPNLTIPDTDPPAELSIATVVQSDGMQVPEGASVVVHYTGVNWTTGEVFDSSWPRGEPTSFSVDGVIPGFRDAIVGQTVGSRVVSIIPPESGYGLNGGPPGSGIGGADTLVFVIDILASTE